MAKASPAPDFTWRIGPGAFGEEIRLIRVLPGDRRVEARKWALTAKTGKFTFTAEADEDAVRTTQEQRCLLPAEP